jgi:hypothetical protein
MLPDFNRADRIREFWGYPETRTFAELLLDCEEDRTLFPHAAWLRLIGEAGFDVRLVPLVHDERRVVAGGFLATRPR